MSAFDLNVGVLAIALPENEALIRIAHGANETYFIVADLATNASQQTPNSFRVTHLTQSSSTAVDADSDIPLRIAATENVTSDLVDLQVGPTINGDINRSGTIDAVDVQLVINAVLGIDIAPFNENADVNDDDSVDAVDVQLVINGALGLDIGS